MRDAAVLEEAPWRENAAGAPVLRRANNVGSPRPCPTLARRAAAGAPGLMQLPEGLSWKCDAFTPPGVASALCGPGCPAARIRMAVQIVLTLQPAIAVRRHAQPVEFEHDNSARTS